MLHELAMLRNEVKNVTQLRTEMLELLKSLESMKSHIQSASNTVYSNADFPPLIDAEVAHCSSVPATTGNGKSFSSLATNMQQHHSMASVLKSGRRDKKSSRW